MTIENICDEFLWIPHKQYRYGLGPGEWLVLTSLDPDDNMEIAELIRQHKLAIVADNDIEDYTFNVDEPDAEEIDTPDISDTFNNIRFKE